MNKHLPAILLGHTKYGEARVQSKKQRCTNAADAFVSSNVPLVDRIEVNQAASPRLILAQCVQPCTDTGIAGNVLIVEVKDHKNRSRELKSDYFKARFSGCLCVG